MNIALRMPMTVPEYLAWADAQAEGPRTELINGQVTPMSPERFAHTDAKLAIAIALRRAIEATGVDCRAYTDGVTIPIDDHTAYQPDATVLCGPRPPSHEMESTNPLVVVEVISPTSAHTDTSAKLIGYFKLPSVRHYLIVDPDARTVTLHRRGDDGLIAAETHTAGALRLDPPGLALTIEDLFE